MLQDWWMSGEVVWWMHIAECMKLDDEGEMNALWRINDEIGQRLIRRHRAHCPTVACGHNRSRSDGGRDRWGFMSWLSFSLLFHCLAYIDYVVWCVDDGGLSYCS